VFHDRNPEEEDSLQADRDIIRVDLGRGQVVVEFLEEGCLRLEH
jgi:hypothetical protein